MTPELRLARAGKLTASKASIVMGGLDTKGLSDYVMQLAWERVYGVSDDHGYTSPAMERGTLLEAEALSWYAFETGSALDQDSDRTIVHPDFPTVAASPDALLSDRCIEVKCPMPRAWMETKKTGQVPSVYRWQCRWQQWVCGKRQNDYISYHPSAGGIIVPVYVTDEEIQQMEERVPIIEARIMEWVKVLEDK